MKLWQKIFLISLAFVMLSVSVTAVVAAQNYFNMTLDIEKQGAAARHEYIASGVANRITLENLSSEELIMTPEELRPLIRSVVSSQADAAHGIAVFDRDGEISYSQIGSLSDLTDLRNKVEQGSAPCAVITDHAGTSRLVVGSVCEWSGREYFLYTSTDISTVYRTRASVFSFIRIFSIATAAVSSFVLLLIVYFMLRPLSKINASIRKISSGAYDARVEPNGGYEFRELSGNINQMAQAIEENVSRLEEIAESRKRFVDDLAHEMKTPLTSIICLSDVMHIKKNLSQAERVEFSGIIMDEAKRLRGLSGKLLELTVAGNAELDFRAVFLPELLSAIEAAAQPVFVHSGMTLLVQPADCSIRCDRELFTSLILNLLDNARKASATGDTVELRCHVRRETLTLAVVDHGIGMSEAEMKHITEPFYMVDKSRSRRAGGAGLGLSLCAEIAARHHAVLTFDSAPGRGTVVTLNMPTGGGYHE